MSSKQIEVQKKKTFFKSYTATGNIENVGHLYCCCQIYSGCQTIQIFLRKLKRYCCYFQFADRYNLHYLNKIKRDVLHLKLFYNEILGDITVLKAYQNVNRFASDFNIFDSLCYITNLNEEWLNQLEDFLLYL